MNAPTPTPATTQPRPAAKHTPGPWRATCEGYIASTNNGYVPIRTPFRKDAFVDGPTRSDHKEETLQANARLIAAAPAMKETLEYLAGKIAHIRRALVATGQADFCNAWGILEAEDAARAAIAQAEGGAQ